MQRTLWILLAASVASAAHAQTATFDNLSEGTTSTTIVENGITFSDLDQFFPGVPPPRPFAVEQSNADLTGQPGFTPDNTLGFGGWSPGPGTSYGRCGSFSITPPQVSSAATVEVFVFEFDVGNSIDFIAFRNGAEVSRTSQPVPRFPTTHLTLSMQGVEFDRLQVLGSGPNNQGSFFASIDTVVITPAGGAECNPDLNDDGNSDQDDVACLVAAIAGNPGCTDEDLDFNEDGNADQDDIASLINVVAGGPCP